MTFIDVKILDTDLYPKYHSLPQPATPGSAGIDLIVVQDVILMPGTCLLVGTGLAIHIKNPKICALIMPRSGLGHKEGIILGNTTGVIDSDYQGELKISLWNRGDKTKTFNRGDKVAQLLFVPILTPVFNIVTDFVTTDRGAGGWGHTGV